MALTECVIKRNNDRNLDPKENRLLAAKMLNGGALKLYCYFEYFKKGQTIYRRKDFCKEINMSADTANKAFQELLDTGYLVPDKEPEIYIFFLNPAENEDDEA